MKTMNKLLVIIFSFIIASCSSTPKIAGIDRPDYEPYSVSENKPTIDGKYIGCTLKESKDFRTFHVGNGKVSNVFSTFGQAKPGMVETASHETIDLIEEDENFFVMGESNRERIKSYGNYITWGERCGVGLNNGWLNLKETIYKIDKRDGWFVETIFHASSTEETRDGYKSIGGGGECKLFIETRSFGACNFEDVNPDVDKFLEPYKPNKLE